jgi:succinoglycan biosynthesis protein ExoA
VSENLPSVTIVIAARPGQAQVQAVAGARALRYPEEKLEVIVARGRQPSAQRNRALQAARGEWVYFLDDDSVADPHNLERAARYFSAPETRMVGGPNICPPEAPGLEQVFALVLSSCLAFGPSRARYTPVGQPRAASEKELILCNLLARRSAMLELGGFNEALYPNEENALMDELQKRGGKLMYDPELIVYRRPRSNLRAFARMLLTYGRGRAEQFRLHPTFGSLLNFVPPLFCVYLLGLIAALIAAPRLGKLLLAPLGLYFFMLLVQASLLMGKRSGQHAPAMVTRLFRAMAAVPLIFLTHALYGLGFWRGLFTKLGSARNASQEVVLDPLKELGKAEWISTSGQASAIQ